MNYRDASIIILPDGAFQDSAGIVSTGIGATAILMDNQAFKRSSFPLLEFGQCWLVRGERQRGIWMQGERPCIDQLAIAIQVHAQIGNSRLKRQLGHIRQQHLETPGDRRLPHEIGFVSQFPNDLVLPVRLMLARSRFALPVKSPQAKELAQKRRSLRQSVHPVWQCHHAIDASIPEGDLA